MAEAILQKLGACKNLLSALSSRPGYGKTSSVEAQRAQALLRVTPLGTEDMGKVAEAIQTAGFAEADAAALLDTLADLAGSGEAEPVLKARRVTKQGQDYSELRHYLVPSVMASLVEQKNVCDLMDHLLRLGLRNPGEPTFQAIAVLVLHATEGFDQTMAMAPAMKLLFVQTMKETFRDRLKLVRSALFNVRALPRDPEKFKRDFPSLYDASFKDSAPMPAPISELEWTLLKRGVRMRKERGAASLELALASSGGSSSAMHSNLLQFGQAMAGQMKVLAQEIANLKRSSSDPVLTFLPQASSPQASRLALTVAPAGPDTAEEEPPAPHLPSPTASTAVVAGVAGNDRNSQPPAEDAKAVMTVDEVTKEIAAALEKNKGTTKGKAKAKGKGKVTLQAKEKGKAKAKAKAVLPVAAIARKGWLSKPPAMPAFKKQGPIYWGSCTIYTDSTKGQWRACEAGNRRKDMKFKWSKEAWQRLLSWCRESGHDL